MLNFSEKKLFINNEEILINAAEIHYFRVPKNRWEETIILAKEAGMNTIAAYIPWYLHEFFPNEFDFTGIRHEQNNLIEFLELCAKHNMYFFARPGPYIMAEFVNEGLPDYIYELPDITPYSWHGKKPIPPVVDYLNPHFLNAAKKWFKMLEDEVFTKFNNILAIQLCNEIGMLHWVSNSPDLTENSKEQFATWLKDKKNGSAVECYGVSLKKIETISEEKILEFHDDFHRFSRTRYEHYVELLKEYWEDVAKDKYLYIVNIHGCGGGRSLTYPLGISQLIDSYRDKDKIISGSDIYLSEVGIGTIQDIYLANAYTAASNGKNQPLTSVEFSDGDSNYANSFSERTLNSSLGMKIDLFYLQENKLLNFYTFAGGTNYRVEKDYHNGFNRFSFTGETHGFASPIGPSGEIRHPYHAIKETMYFYNNFNSLIAKMKQTVSNVEVAFVSEYYLNEYHLPESKKERELIENLQSARGDDFYSTIGRALLLTGYSFKAIDVNYNEIVSDILITPTAKYMSEELQTKYVKALENTTKIIFYGEVPEYNLKGEPCTILQDYLEITIHQEIKSDHIKHTKVSLKPLNYSKSVETYTHFAQLISSPKGKKLFEVYQQEHGAGIIGENFAFISGKYRCDLDFIESLLESFAGKKNYHTDYPDKLSGIFTSSLKYEDEEFIYVFNFDDVTKEFNLYKNKNLVMKNLKIASRETIILPVNIKIPNGIVNFATAKLIKAKENELIFKTKEKFFTLELTTEKEIKEETFLIIKKAGKQKRIEVDMRLLDEIVQIKLI